MAHQSIERISTESRQVPEQAKQDFKNQEWFTSLDWSSQQKVIELFAKIEDLKKKLDWLNAEWAYKWTAAKSLFARINNNSKMKWDPEAQPTLDLYEFYRKGAETALSKKVNTETEITKLEAMIKAMSDWLGDMQSIAQEMHPEAGQKKHEWIETAQKDISKMSNADILKLAPAERLPYITKWSVDAGKVISGETKTVEFTFSSEGKLNRDLYMYTTAGQVLPSEVRRVSSGGQQYERIWTSGEFYNTTNQKRLVIWEGTKLDSIETWDISKLSEQNTEIYQEFIKNNSEYGGEKYKNIIETAIEKWIEPKMFAVVAERRNEEFESQNKIEQHELDIIAADIGRALSGMPKSADRYSIETASKIAQKTTPTTWQETLEKYWYKQEEITAYTAQNPEKVEQYNLSTLNDFTPAEYSYPVERSESGTTLCSRTAYLNLQRLWVSGHPRLWSANASMEAYGSSASTEFPPSGWSGQKVWDFFLGWHGWSENFQKYGHRVAGFQKDGQWYILDPYYKINGSNTRQPIPIELYRQTMQAQGKDFKWVRYYA